jgi:hypothetical protein
MLPVGEIEPLAWVVVGRERGDIVTKLYGDIAQAQAQFDLFWNPDASRDRRIEAMQTLKSTSGWER